MSSIDLLKDEKAIAIMYAARFITKIASSENLTASGLLDEIAFLTDNIDELKEHLHEKEKKPPLRSFQTPRIYAPMSSRSHICSECGDPITFKAGTVVDEDVSHLVCDSAECLGKIAARRTYSNPLLNAHLHKGALGHQMEHQGLATHTQVAHHKLPKSKIHKLAHGETVEGVHPSKKEQERARAAVAFEHMRHKS